MSTSNQIVLQTTNIILGIIYNPLYTYAENFQPNKGGQWIQLQRIMKCLKGSLDNYIFGCN